MDFLETLNPRQKEAVLHTEGPLLILAGAGSGKTRVIICRIAHLIRSCSAAPDSILAVTFTNKAAQEMRSRVAALLSASGAPLTSFPLVSTFHSFCVRLLRSRGAPLAQWRNGFTTDFSIYDENDQVAVVKSVYRQLGLDETFMKARSVLSIVSHAKNQGRGPQDFYREATGPQGEKLAVIFDRYQQALLASNALDFDDLLLEGVRLLRHSQEVRKRVNSYYQFLMVDEYQDTNRPQYELMQLLTQRQQNVCVVGDEDQSIYSWRGADIRNILDFERDYPQATVVRLEQNYRSTKRILAAASSVVGNNLDRKGKTLWTEGDEGDALLLYESEGSEQEARFVAECIDNYLIAHRGRQAAVLYRTNAQSRQIEEALRRLNRDYIVVGGVSFYERAEVKDLIAYLRVAISPTDSVGLVRVINRPARGIGKTTVEQITHYAQQHGLNLWEAMGRMLDENVFPSRAQRAVASFRTLIERLQKRLATEPVHSALIWLVDESGYKHILEQDGSIEAAGRLENINELINAAADASQRGEDVQSFLDQAALVSDTDQIDQAAPVLLMTLHSAKGLEFPLVVITGLEESIFPHSRCLEDAAALEEERRLCYVGMTRARERLVLTWARTRRRYGGGSPERMIPSRFLAEIPKDLVDHRLGGSLAPYGESQWKSEELNLYAEQHTAREMARKRPYPGKTYNSAQHVADFFAERKLPIPGNLPRDSSTTGPTPPSPSKAKRPSRGVGGSRQSREWSHSSGFRLGAKVRHAQLGVGTVLRLEGEGENTKLTVHFQSHGLKKLVAKYAGLQPL